MNMEQAIKELQQIAGGRYCGIEHRIAQYPRDEGPPQIQTDFRVFIEMDKCPVCNDNSEYISVDYQATLESALKKIRIKLAEHLDLQNNNI